MQATGARMRIPGAARAMLFKYGAKARGVIGEMLQRHRAVFDKGNGLTLLLHRHHDIEARGSYLCDRRL